MRRFIVAAAAIPLLVPGAATGRAAALQPDAGAAGSLHTWDVQVTRAQLPLLARAGADLSEVAPPAGDRPAAVELVLTGNQAAALRAGGLRVTERTAVAPAGAHVFRPYSGPGGLADELRAIAAAHPDLAKVESIGKTTQGKDILAVKVTKGAGAETDGSRPATFYFGAQHAREWITPEMIRRLLHHFVDGYGTDAETTALVNTDELWFMPVANPDGYDYTFSDAPGARLWRKNLRDNNGDGKIAPGDGVDLNRNFGWKWGWDDEGSSSDPANDIYRGPGPDSEPESKAFNAFEQRVKPKLAINYHSAAQALLYGVGWQTATGTPDDTMYRALTGVPDHPAVPDTTPEVGSDLYTFNGDADGQSVNVNGVPMFSDEMDTCATAAGFDPADAWKPEDCPSTFEFPDDESLIQTEFTRNLPLAVAAAKSAANPAEPISPVGLSATALNAQTFTTSYSDGAAQRVAVTARKSITNKRLHYRINGGHEQTAPVTAWTGGRTYGGTDNLYYDQYRGQVIGASPGDSVDVWFSGASATSAHFTYQVATRAKADTLVLADEGAAQRNAAEYADAAGGAAIWDVATQGAPDPLGVLDHFSTVVWEVGDHTSDAATTLAVRDFLNEGGKLVRAGAAAGLSASLNASGVSGDDFDQYWLGVDSPSRVTGAIGFTGTGALRGAKATFIGPTQHGVFLVTSDTYPAAQFPQFASAPAGVYTGVTGQFEPFDGAGMAAIRHSDNAYARLTRTIDLTAATSAKLSFDFSYDTEPGYDSAIVEAHTVGADDWTTLPDLSGSTVETPQDDCVLQLGLHPFLRHYLTQSGDGCTATGTSGAWHRVTGNGAGWHPAAFDLSAFAGRKVEVSIAYVSDDVVGGHGAFVDDAQVQINGTAGDPATFESTLVPWTAAPPPAGSPAGTTAWTASGAVLHSYAAVSTVDTVTIGFGLESLTSTTARRETLRQAMSRLS